MKTLLNTILALLISLISHNLAAQNYCDSAGNSSEEWIQKVQIGNFVQHSGNDNGYAFYSNSDLELTSSQQYNFLLEPGYSGDAYHEHWRIWIDFNDDGDFNESNELLYDSEAGFNSALSGTFTIPTNIETNQTRMRIAMKYVGDFDNGDSDNSPPQACADFDYGEVEDYSVSIIGGGSSDNYCPLAAQDSNTEWIQSASFTDTHTETSFITVSDQSTDLDPIENEVLSIRIFPNPATDFLKVDIGTAVSDQAMISIYTTIGQRVAYQEVFDTQAPLNINVQELPVGIYHVALEDGERSISKRLMINR